jgi:hypothetical protein
MPLDYHTPYTAQLAENVQLVGEAAAADAIEPALAKRIDNFAARHGLDRAEIIAALRGEDPETARAIATAAFATDPVKQNFGEQQAALYIRGMTRLVDQFRKLPTSGVNALSVANGAIVTNPGRDGEIKSIDFTWRTGPYRVYASHKWTREGGGGQKHQYDELRRFLSVTGRCQPRLPALPEDLPGAGPDGRLPVLFVAICDGAYFTPARIASLTAAAGGVSHAAATPIDLLGVWLRRRWNPRTDQQLVPAPPAPRAAEV